VLRYTLKTLPVPAAIAAGLVVAALLWLVDRWPWQMWPAAGIAAAAAGAAASRFFDEPAASIVDTLPRALWWRTVARLIPAGVLGAAWVAGVSAIDLQQAGRPDLLRLAGLATILAAAAATTALRRRGHATPSFAVGSTMLLVLTFLALSNPLPRLLPLFPYGPDGAWTASRWLWTGIALAAAAVIACTWWVGGRLHVRRPADPARRMF
jgi:hypothetical protein